MIFAQLPPEAGFWGWQPGPGVFLKLVLIFLVFMAVMIAMMNAPTRARRPIIWTFTFLSGLFYVTYFVWPRPINRQAGDIPRDGIERFGFTLEDALPHVASIANILTAFLLGLGIYSLVRIHSVKLIKKQQDWLFSAVLLVSMLTMVIIGYWDWILTLPANDPEGLLIEKANWGFANYARDLLFEGLLQQMDAAMFSMIAFFILSAAYRAFRIRSVEATVLMASALVLMLSLMGALDYMWGQMIEGLAGGNQASAWMNFKITEVANWLRNTMQVPSLRALEFGIGLGALAMGLRLWLGLEKGGVSA